MNENPRQIPIYTTKGEPAALLVYPYIYNLYGEWVGWITPEREVFSLLGFYVGYLSNEPRILRKRYKDWISSRVPTPPPAPHIQAMATIPLAPLMPELMYDTMDVLMEEPETLHTQDMGELKEDLD
ncbi:MAG TPA: hypothetical protein VFM18_01370 [Methanosarcina sp.]|nr:hypothetical protein [Methanosarcina sp.]